jgi:hypothetical protein
MTEADKYRQFRNFMTNELGITREDIRAWTTQSVATEISKLVGQLNIDDMVSDAVKKAVDSALDSNTTFYRGDRAKLREAIAKEIAKGVSIQITAKD